MHNEYEIISKKGKLFDENSFLCINTEEQTGILIDPSTRDFSVVIEEKAITIVAILLTHAHFDHILEVDYYAHKYQAPVYLHILESRKLSDPLTNLSRQMNEDFIVETKPTIVSGNTGTIKVPGFELHYVAAPGHSEGNLIFQVNQLPIYFVGDTVFKDSIGRFDLPGSNTRAHHESLKKFLEYNDDARFYPGHGGIFRVKDLAENAVFQQFIRIGI